MKLQKYILAWVALALIALTVFAMPAAADFTDVPEGGTVLLGEQGLDISDCVNGYDHIAFWVDPDEDPVRSIDLSGYNLEAFDITGWDFTATADGAYWYQYDPGDEGERGDPAFKVVTPRAEIEIVNLDLSSLDITDGSASTWSRKP